MAEMNSEETVMADKKTLVLGALQLACVSPAALAALEKTAGERRAKLREDGIRNSNNLAKAPKKKAV